jgi:hypothetical protein
MVQHDIVTLDESWFYLSTDYEFVRLSRDKKVSERERHTIQSKIHIHDRFESARVPFDQGSRKRSQVHTGYFIAEILEPLSECRSIEAAVNERKFLVHANNARPHTAQLSIQYFNENRMKSAPHPPYSPDLAPSDFYFFGYVKRCLAGLSFEDADQIFAVVEGVLEGIEKQPCKAVFLEWRDRLRKCIATNGEYIE